MIEVKRMVFKEIRDGNTIFWTYKNLCIGLIEGNTSFHLTQLDTLALPTAYELSPFKEDDELNREFCAGMQFQPPLDFTACRLHDTTNTSLMTFGLDLTAIKNLHASLASHLSFTPIPPSPQIIADVLPALPWEIKTYRYAEKVTAALQAPFSNVWAAFRFNNFLVTYKGVHLDEALRESFQKYNLPLDSLSKHKNK